MPGRVLERAVYIRSEPLHFLCEFFFLVRFRLVGWSAGHRCGGWRAALSLRAAAGVQLLVQCAGRAVVGAALRSTGQASWASLRQSVL